MSFIKLVKTAKTYTTCPSVSIKFKSKYGPQLYKCAKGAKSTRTHMNYISGVPIKQTVKDVKHSLGLSIAST